MHSSISNSDFLAAEQRWLARYGWIISVVGIPFGLIIDGLFWTALTLDRSYLPAKFGEWITLKGMLFGCAIAFVPVLWKIGLLMETKWGTILRKYAVVPVLVVAVLVLAELMLRLHPMQDFLWQSVRARSGTDYFAREISLLRLEAASVNAFPVEHPGIVVAGSSQMLHAMDGPVLSQLSGLPVHRRATAGMFPIEMCAAQEFMDFNKENILLLMLSGFDLGGRNELITDAIRPIATSRGVRDVLRASNQSFAASHWRSFTDLFTASVCDGWRSRDYIRFVYRHPFAAKMEDLPKAVDQEQIDRQREAYVQLGSNEEVVMLSRSSLHLFLEHMSSRVKRIVVVEGRVHPDYPDPAVWKFSLEMKQFLEEQERQGLIDYVPVEDQKMDLTVDDWLDMAHVNQVGRSKYTEMFARVILAASANQP